MKRVLIALTVVAALVVAADRGGLWLTEKVAADHARGQGLAGAAVDVRGTPFLTQLAARDLHEVEVTGDVYRTHLGDRGAGGAGPGSIDITDLRVLARDVAIDSRRDFTAAEVTVDAVVPYAAVFPAAGSQTEVTAATNGQVRVLRRVRILGRSMRVRALARVTAVDGQIVVRPTEASVDGAGRLGDLALDAVLPLLTTRYPLPALPEGLVLTRVAPSADGFAVTLTGREVSLGKLR